MREILESKGITLIALIITIIVLLILAGITISLTVGQNGIMNMAEQAGKNYIDAEQKEKEILASYDNEIDEVLIGNREQIMVDKEEYEQLVNEVRDLKVQNTMSETEHFTGEYYINGKPIYAKTIYISSLPNTTLVAYPHNTSDVEEIWFDVSKSYCIWADGTRGPLPFLLQNNLSNSIQLSGLTTTEFNIRTGNDRSTLSAYVTINYTKTTDVVTNN